MRVNKGSNDRVSTLKVAKHVEPPVGRYWLVVVGEGVVATHPLPTLGDVIIGKIKEAVRKVQF